jgi:hypothetical protein
MVANGITTTIHSSGNVMMEDMLPLLPVPNTTMFVVALKDTTFTAEKKQKLFGGDNRLEMNEQHSKDEPCRTCGDEGEIKVGQESYKGFYGYRVYKEPCPDCQDKPEQKPEAKCVQCGKLFYCADDYDTLGSDSGVCCPDCGGEDFEPEQKPQSELAKEFRDFLKNDPLNFHKKWIRLSYETCKCLDEALAEIRKLKGD